MDEGKTIVHVCMTGCRACGSAEVKDALEEEAKKQGLSAQVEIRATGCHGFCAKAPVVAVEPMENSVSGGSARRCGRDRRSDTEK